MRRYELTFEGLNTATYARPIRVLVLKPDRVGEHTGGTDLFPGDPCLRTSQHRVHSPLWNAPLPLLKSLWEL